MDDRLHMRRALRLAARARGRVSPNPMVGAVIVEANGTVVGEGYHRQVGGPHAEVHALAQAGSAARGATMYCTLEPCSFVGRTPACSAAVVEAGIRRLVCALPDPDHRVSGKGFAMLRDAGIDVEVGTLEAAAQELIGPYLHQRRTGHAWVTLKLGMSLDGRIATGDGQSRWITGEAARRHAHRWRSWVDGLIVGAGTVLADDPALTVRHVRGRDPRPIVVDGRLRCDPSARVFSGPKPILVTADSAPAAKRQAFADQGVEVWDLPATDGAVDLRQVTQKCSDAGLLHVILEGGAHLAAAALQAGIVGDVMIYQAPRFLGADGLAGIGDLQLADLSASPWLSGVQRRRLGPDQLLTGKLETTPCSPD